MVAGRVAEIWRYPVKSLQGEQLSTAAIDDGITGDRRWGIFSAAKPGKTVAAFCHRMVTIQYLRRLMGYSDPHAVRINYCGITRIQASSSTDARSVRSVNETAHLGEALVISP